MLFKLTGERCVASYLKSYILWCVKPLRHLATSRTKSSKWSVLIGRAGTKSDSVALSQTKCLSGLAHFVIMCADTQAKQLDSCKASQDTRVQYALDDAAAGSICQGLPALPL